MVDSATDAAPAYYMINCTHPTEFEPALTVGNWVKRLGGFMPNAVAIETLALCKLGHLEDGDAEELGHQMAELAERFPHIMSGVGAAGLTAAILARLHIVLAKFAVLRENLKGTFDREIPAARPIEGDHRLGRREHRGSRTVAAKDRHGRRQYLPVNDQNVV